MSLTQAQRSALQQIADGDPYASKSRSFKTLKALRDKGFIAFASPAREKLVGIYYRRAHVITEAGRVYLEGRR